MSGITDKYIEELLNNINLIKPEDIPNINLYMDQVTTFMEEHLGALKRFDDDKILTKTMINNYAKNDLLPPPEKKKYSKDHLLMLTFIYYFKSILSIGDIKTLTGELTEKYFHSDGDINLTQIYTELLKAHSALSDNFSSSISMIEEYSMKCFDGKVADDEYLSKFLFIALLGMEVYMKKQLIESMIDDLEKEKKSE